MKTLSYIIIAYVVVFGIFNLFLLIKRVRESLNRTVLGAIDVISNMIAFSIWNQSFRDYAIVDKSLFWVIAVIMIIQMLVGCINVAIGIMTCDSGHV